MGEETTMKRAASELKKAKAASGKKSGASDPPENVRRAAVLRGMGYEEFLATYSEGDADDIVAQRGGGPRKKPKKS